MTDPWLYHVLTVLMVGLSLPGGTLTLTLTAHISGR